METMDAKYLADARKRHNTPMPETRAAARTTDPDTSHEAAASVRNLTETHEAILTCFRHSAASVGITDPELGSLYNSMRRREHGEFPQVSDSGLRTRRKELVSLGKIIDTGKRRITPSGRKSIVWKIATDA